MMHNCNGGSRKRFRKHNLSEAAGLTPQIRLFSILRHLSALLISLFVSAREVPARTNREIKITDKWRRLGKNLICDLKPAVSEMRCRPNPSRLPPLQLRIIHSLRSIVVFSFLINKSTCFLYYFQSSGFKKSHFIPLTLPSPTGWEDKKTANYL